MKWYRILLCVLLIAVMLFAPHRLIPLAQRDFFAEVRQREPPSFVGTIVLYHIVSERTYAGSVTNWLQAQADAYESRHRGTHILVEGMTEAPFWERIENGRVPDAYSFFSGVLKEDRLQPIGMQSKSLRKGLSDTPYAVPYFFSGYARLYTEQSGVTLPEPDPVAAAYAALLPKEEQSEPEKKPKAKSSQRTAAVRQSESVIDLRAVGDALRNEETGAVCRAEPCGNFTDAVCWLGIARDTDAKKAEALRGFYAFLQEEKQQQSLSALGVFAVCEDVVSNAPVSALQSVWESYQTVQTVDPFRFAAEREELLADAEKALTGGEAERSRFNARLDDLLQHTTEPDAR